jgi:hypothetical protein
MCIQHNLFDFLTSSGGAREATNKDLDRTRGVKLIENGLDFNF